jgi:Domain of unknown function (DUF4326)
MMKPTRIQLRRTKGWRMPPNTVKVDRTTKWGNPFHVVQPDPKDSPLQTMMDAQHGVCFTAEAAVNRFKRLLKAFRLRGSYCANEKKRWWVSVAMIRKELRGKNLACWCKPGTPCHADVLLKIANK